MKRLLAPAALALSCVLFLAIPGQAQNVVNHVIAVSRTGTVYAKPDLAILTLVVRSSGPFAEDAVKQNEAKVKDIQAALAALGYGLADYKITTLSFGKEGGPYMMPNQPAPMGAEASQFVYVFYEGADLENAATLSQKAAAVIDALAKPGAFPSSVRGPFFPGQQQGGTLVYTVKDPSKYERQAVQQALADARQQAEEIAKQTGVRLTSLNWGSTGFARNEMSSQQLEGLPYLYYSTESDAVKITEPATLRFNFK